MPLWQFWRRRPSNKRIAPGCTRVTLHLVCPGEDDVSGHLTENGRTQARDAAREIKRDLRGQPALVLEARRFERAPYIGQTTAIIGEMGGLYHIQEPGRSRTRDLIDTGLGRLDADTVQELSGLHESLVVQARHGEPEKYRTTEPDLHLVMVVPHRILHAYGQACFAFASGFGPEWPPRGSVHRLVIEYDRLTGRVDKLRFEATCLV